VDKIADVAARDIGANAKRSTLLAGNAALRDPPDATACSVFLLTGTASLLRTAIHVGRSR